MLQSYKNPTFLGQFAGFALSSAEFRNHFPARGKAQY
jgi:hypothetical protein